MMPTATLFRVTLHLPGRSESPCRWLTLANAIQRNFGVLVLTGETNLAKARQRTRDKVNLETQPAQFTTAEVNFNGPDSVPLLFHFFLTIM